MSTRIGSALQVGTAALVSLATSVMLYVGGQLWVERNINFVGNQGGTATGAMISFSGANLFTRNSIQCTGTGGGPNYDSCITQSPFNTTGALMWVSVECGSMPVASQKVEVGFVELRSTSSGNTMLNDVALLTGAYVGWATGSGGRTWNPRNFLKAQFTKAPTTSQNCVMRYEAYDKYGT